MICSGALTALTPSVGFSRDGHDAARDHQAPQGAGARGLIGRTRDGQRLSDLVVEPKVRAVIERTLKGSPERVLDELQVHQVPVLFGGGRRLFDALPERVELEIVRVIDSSEPSRSISPLDVRRTRR